MRIGLIARADFTGLGMQTHAFYRHMKPAKTLIVDLSHLNNQVNDFDRYPGAKVVRYTPYPEPTSGSRETRMMIDEFLNDLDIVFTCETPYDYYLFTRARERGIKTVMQYNFEFLDHVRDPNLPQPDLFIAPSLWHYNDVKFINKVFLPVPVDREQFKYRHRTEAVTFLHIGGNPAAEDRNGTLTLINAWQHVQSPANLIIRSQARFRPSRDKRVVIMSGLVKNHADLYDQGDVFLMPRKFGGLCLPLNEALSCGMPTVMTDVSPQNQFLPSETLISAHATKQIMTKSLIDIFEVNPVELASKVDELYNSSSMVSDLSERSGNLAERLSWERMAPVYREVFSHVINDQHPGVPFTW